MVIPSPSLVQKRGFIYHQMRAKHKMLMYSETKTPISNHVLFYVCSWMSPKRVRTWQKQNSNHHPPFQLGFSRKYCLHSLNYSSWKCGGKCLPFHFPELSSVSNQSPVSPFYMSGTLLLLSVFFASYLVKIILSDILKLPLNKPLYIENYPPPHFNPFFLVHLGLYIWHTIWSYN